ncbi:DEAD/DEAH box helicase [Deinococcus budaensis]|uniref:DEAD/DEAH box helicase domain-containing protein n=1 Tax=Deinococcus budaensis TaxID=1665626 RepID=A0A7W8LR63_9DEIO|nr:DEAD/DEAH box helicase [Deinococcus budaensis]MBB5235578.1 DEAD/DEAH box helicase domain-containing protein [Deinococcus budaensis]
MTTLPADSRLPSPGIAQWREEHVIHLPSRPARLVPLSDVPCGTEVQQYLRVTHPGGIYQHQADAARCAVAFKHFAVTTGTASGKTLCFHLAAMEALSALEETRVLVLYPQKALGAEQESRWRTALAAAGIHAPVGRIDGQVPTSQREQLLMTCRVVIMTPDVMHAWLLSNLGRKAVRRFIRDTRLIIADEVHTFTGVFGSNAAYLLRRFEHASKMLTRKRLQYVCASATIADPAEHLRLLTGHDFTIIGPDRDGSPRQPVSLHFLSQTDEARDLLTGTSHLLHHLAERGEKFLCFSDSRKQTENLASIMARKPEQEDEETGEEGNPLDQSPLAHLSVLPYRSGYEARDRTEIQTRLERGQLDGVISTSALELGMDIPHLDAVVLLGVPLSTTSLHQRIGRVGRRKPGRVLILHSGSPSDGVMFEEPQRLLDRPLAASTLYLENANIQCIHALCLARRGGEHDALLTALNRDTDTDFVSPVQWPAGFLEVIEQERTGTLPAALQPLRAQAGENPNHAFPLRDVETSYKVEVRQGNGPLELGTLSYGQVMREAYPGAVYLYATRAYRVTRVNPLSRTIQARPERRFSTQPVCLPTLAFPNLDLDSIHQAEGRGSFTAIDCNVMISETVIGFAERRGPNTFNCSYPLDAHETGIYFQHNRFARNFYSTGVVLHHPALQGDVPRSKAAEYLLEGFRMAVPFESRDIGVTTDKLRVERPGLTKGDAMIVIYDQTYGSLRLSSKLLSPGVLEAVFGHACALAENAMNLGDCDDRAAVLETLALLRHLQQEVSVRATPLTWLSHASQEPQPEDRVRVILEGSKGICLLHANREMSIQQVYYSPRAGLQYKGRLATDNSWETHLTVVAVEGVQFIPGISEMGWYDLEQGELIPDTVEGAAG